MTLKEENTNKTKKVQKERNERGWHEKEVKWEERKKDKKTVREIERKKERKKERKE